MSRPLRIKFPGAWYHIMNRGAAKQKIFDNDNHYKIFINLLNELHNRFQVRIHSYCLMPNHYHLLIQTPLPNLSSAMRHLDSLYTRRYNILQNRDGPLFRGRFKSILVDSENYLLQLSRYIHLNPVVAKLVTKAEDYSWSSYQAYLDDKLKPYWLSTDETLDRFGTAKKVQKYRIFIAEGIDNEINTFYKKLMLMPILGCEAFNNTISEKYLKDKKISSEISQKKYLRKIPNIEQIMQIVAAHYKIDEANLKIVKRKPSNKPRQIAIYLSCKLPDQKYQLIADKFTNITAAGVAKIYQRTNKQITYDNKLEEEIAMLKKLLAF